MNTTKAGALLVVTVGIKNIYIYSDGLTWFEIVSKVVTL